MKKALFILSISIFFVFTIFIGISIYKSQKENYITNLKQDFLESLNNHEYNNAYQIYSTDDGEYNELFEKDLNEYINNLCDSSMKNLNSDDLKAFLEAGWKFQKISQVIEEINIKLGEISESNQNYQIAIDKYSNREFIDSKEYFESVIEADENYENSVSYLQALDARAKSWDENEFGRSPYANACTADDKYIYMPYVMDGINGIFKISYDGVGQEFFPLSDQASVLSISGINIVGDYLYFIAGENVGSGYIFDSPYCIYEMKKDGTELVLAAEGNFTDLYIYEDKAYAISREEGFIEFNREFSEKKIITEGNVVNYSFTDEGLYYSVQDNLQSNSDNTVYLYDGSKSTEIETKAKLRYYYFGDEYLKEWYLSEGAEVLYYSDGEKEIKIDDNNFRKIYGFLEGKVFYTINGSLGQETLRAYDTESKKIINVTDFYVAFPSQILNIFYEADKMILDDGNYILFSNLDGTEIKAVGDVDISDEKLAENSIIINHMSDEEIYLSSDEVIISVLEEKQNWIYRDDNLSLYAEKRYLEQYDCNVYVTHVFTNDFNNFSTGNATKDSLSASKSYQAPYISDQYNMIYAQSTDAFYYSINRKQGIIIRQGQLVRDILTDDMVAFFDDGSMQVYRAGDDINGEKLIEMGATSSFSFGPILVEDYNIDYNCFSGDVAGKNPRSAIGYVEPGHYVMVACDGRAKEISYGLTMIQLAEVFRDEGCSLAYNLDGGQTTAAMFMGNYITDRPDYRQGSQQHLYRKIAELLYVGTSDIYPIALDEYIQDYESYKSEYK